METVSIDPGVDGELDVVLRGELDFTNAAPVIEAIRGAVAQHRPARVRVDLAKVTFLDSSGIAVLVNAMKAAESVEAGYRVENPNLKVADQLRITGLLEAFGLTAPAEGS